MRLEDIYGHVERGTNYVEIAPGLWTVERFYKTLEDVEAFMKTTADKWLMSFGSMIDDDGQEYRYGIYRNKPHITA